MGFSLRKAAQSCWSVGAVERCEKREWNHGRQLWLRETENQMVARDDHGIVVLGSFFLTDNDTNAYSSINKKYSINGEWPF